MTDDTAEAAERRLSRQRTIFRLVGSTATTTSTNSSGYIDVPPDCATYVATLDEDHDPEPTLRVFHLPIDTFTDMGRPDTVTVTVEPGDALNDLAGAPARVEQARQDVVDQVAEARRNGRSWADIGAVFGISRQAAWERYAALMPEANLTRAWVKTVATVEEWQAMSVEDQNVLSQAAVEEGIASDDMVGADRSRVAVSVSVSDDGSVILRVEESPR